MSHASSRSKTAVNLRLLIAGTASSCAVLRPARHGIAWTKFVSVGRRWGAAGGFGSRVDRIRQLPGGGRPGAEVALAPGRGRDRFGNRNANRLRFEL